MAVSMVLDTPSQSDQPDFRPKVTPTTGNWLVAIVTWRYQITVQLPGISITDAARNVWYLLATRQQQASHVTLPNAGYALCTQVWACPGVRYDGWTYELIEVAIQSCLAGDQGSFSVDIVEFAGMSNNFLTVDSVTPYSSYNTSSITLAAPAAAANCLMVAGAAGSNAYTSYTTSGTGWSQLSNTTATTPALGGFGAWREGSTASSVTFSLTSGTCDWSGVIVAFRTSGIVPTGPADQNPNHPVISSQIGYGYGLAQPLQQVWWTEHARRFWGMSHKRGIQYELGTAQSEPTTMIYRNNDGAFSPRNVSNPPVVTATQNGTGTTFVCSTTGASSALSVTDVFALNYGPLNPNSDFSGGTAHWTGTGGTFTVSGSIAQMVPSGTASTVQIESDHIAVTPGLYYSIFGLLQNAVSRTVTLRANWYDGSGTLLSSSSIANGVTANVLKSFSATFFAPAGAVTGAVAAFMSGTPPTGNVLFADNMSISPQDEFTAFRITGISDSGSTRTITFGEAGSLTTPSLFPTRAGDQLIATPIDLYTPYQHLAAWSGKWHYVTAGWIERWPATFTNKAFGTVGALTVGALSTITGNQQSALAGDIMRRLPHSYWPLGDAAGSTSASNVSGRGLAPLIVTQNKAGSAANQTADFGVGTQSMTVNPSNLVGALPQFTSLFGDTGTCWQQEFDDTPPVSPATIPQGSTDLNNKLGYALVATDSAFPSITNGVSIFFCVELNLSDHDVIANSSTNPTFFILRDTDPADSVGQGSVIKLSYDRNTQQPVMTIWDKASHSNTSTVLTGAGSLSADWTTFLVTFNQGSWKVYNDTILAGSGTCNLVSSFSTIDVGGESDHFYSGNALPSALAHVAIYDRILSAGESNALHYAAITDWGAQLEFTSNRQQRLLDTINMRTARLTGDYTDQTLMDGQGSDASTVADALGNVAAVDDALMFEDASGAIQIRPAGRYQEQQVRATMGGGVGELPYLGDIATDFDPTFLFDVVTITTTIENVSAFNQNSQNTQFVAINDAATDKYNYRNYTRATRISGGALQNMFYLAYWLLSQYATPKQRFRSITLDPIGNPALWDFCLTVEVGDVLLVKRQQMGAPLIAETCVVLQVQVDTAPGQWRMVLTLAPAKPSGILLNDPVKGIAGTNYFSLG